MEKSLRDLLARLPIPGLAESTNRHTIAAIITKTLGVPVVAKQITVREGVLTVSVPPVVKSALHLHSTTLLSAFAEEKISVAAIR